MRYSHSQIENKWQDFWFKNNLFAPDFKDFKSPKFYILDMFPYPSGEGLHVGHIRGYLATDILTRMKKMQGFNVLHPIGFDSFGLPAEQYAIRTNQNPETFTQKNINNFLYQLQSLGFAYDYRFPIVTSDVDFFHWTQWTFLRLYEHKLALLKEKNVNYCPALNTVLANEEIISINGQMLSERGGHPVYLLPKKQWIIPITKYGDELITGLKKLNWTDAVKTAQINWIGKTLGETVELFFQEKQQDSISVFTTNLLELETVDFLSLAINSSKIDYLLTTANKQKLKQLRTVFSQKPIRDQKLINPKPIGMFSGLHVINPLNDKLIPVYFAEYIDEDFAFGNKFSSSACHLQDWFFALVFKLKPLIKKNDVGKQSPLSAEMIKKQQGENRQKLLIKKQIKTAFFYRLKDWIFSRQRYWGEPFPIRYKNNKIIPLKNEELPLKLPKFSINFWKNSKSETLSPLSRISSWVKEGYDLNTMPQWAGSCWYFLAYVLRKKNTYLPLNSPQAKKLLNHWLPVDFYVGGQEHAVSHLLYSRFWNLFLSKINVLDVPEPFSKLRNQGMILSQDGKKMSKSRGNIVDPLSFLISHGADALRLHEKFLGPFFADVKWNETNLDAMRKWLARVYSLFMRENDFWTETKPDRENCFFYSQLVKNVSDNYEKCLFNVGISQLMSFINRCYKQTHMFRDFGIGFLKLLHPICPHITDEIASKWGIKETTLTNSQWPEYQEKDLIVQEANIAVQINGKLKGLLKMPIDSSKIETVSEAKLKFSDFLIKFNIKKIVFVKNKIVNFVIDNS